MRPTSSAVALLLCAAFLVPHVAVAQAERASPPGTKQGLPQAPPIPPAPARVEILKRNGDSHVRIQINQESIDSITERATAAAIAHELAGAAAESAGADAELAGEELERSHQAMHDMGSSNSKLMRKLKLISSDPQGVHLPPADSILPGAFVVLKGADRGRVAALGKLDVNGTVDGDAIAVGGDVIVHRGGHVTGDAVSVGGTATLDGGSVDGELRSIDRPMSDAPVVAATRSGFLLMLDEMQRVMGWLVLMVILGFGVMVLAEERLRIVTETIEGRFGKSVLAGLLTEVSFVPALVIVPVLLVITIVGIVIAPFAVLAIIVLGAGLATLGFLAMARVAGQAMTRQAAPATLRGIEMRSMLAGLCLFFGLWFLAALLGWVPVVGSILHALAVVVTWAAATVGLGAAVISRGGSRRRVSDAPTTPALPEAGWQTPTPISGIAAARRTATTTPEP
jgi:hypothetical protein